MPVVARVTALRAMLCSALMAGSSLVVRHEPERGLAAVRPGFSREASAKLEALYFTRGRLRQLVDEIDPARILVRRKMRFDVLAQLLGKRGGRRMTALQ